MPSPSSMSGCITHSDRRGHTPQGDSDTPRQTYSLDGCEHILDALWEDLLVVGIPEKTTELLALESKDGIKKSLALIPEVVMCEYIQQGKAGCAFPSLMRDGLFKRPEWYVYTLAFGATDYANFMICTDNVFQGRTAISEFYVMHGYEPRVLAKNIQHLTYTLVPDDMAKIVAVDYGLLDADQPLQHVLYCDGQVNMPCMPLSYEGDLSQLAAFNNRSRRKHMDRRWNFLLEADALDKKGKRICDLGFTTTYDAHLDIATRNEDTILIQRTNGWILDQADRGRLNVVSTDGVEVLV